MAGDTVEVLEPGKKPFEMVISQIFDEENQLVDSACHAMMKFKIPYQGVLQTGTIIRKNKAES